GGTVCVWELPCGPELRRSPAGEAAAGPGSPAESRSIHLPNGVTIRTNEATDGELKPRPLGEQVVENAVLSPDGRRVLICVDATPVHIWDREGSGPLLLRHRSPVRYAAFSADGSRVLTACADRSVRLWDAATGEMLAPPMHHALAILRVKFHDGDRQAHVFHAGDTVSIWDLQEDNREADALLNLAEVLAGEYRGRDRQLRPLDLKSWREKWEKLSSAK